MSKVSGAIEGVKQMDNMLSEHGFPVLMASALAIYLIWSTVTAQSLVREITETAAATSSLQTEEARKHSDKLTDVIIADTKAKIEMTTAIKSLEKASNEMGTSLRSLEMRIEKSENFK